MLLQLRARKMTSDVRKDSSGIPMIHTRYQALCTSRRDVTLGVFGIVHCSWSRELKA